MAVKRTVAALYVQKGGIYYDLPGVDPWDEERDARLYDGPHAVVAHPPCARWGRYWNGGPSAKVLRKLGDDGGCFAAALESVRKWGGVLEHPEVSHAWRTFHLNAPPRSGGWVVADFCGGWTCCVEQGHYGHRARKATWLYVHPGPAGDIELPSLKWGASEATLCAPTPPPGRRASKTGACQMMSKKERAATPPEFRDVLLDIARRSRCPTEEEAREDVATRRARDLYRQAGGRGWR